MTDEKVVKLRQVEPDTEVQGNIVLVLEDMLARAKAGTLQNIAFAGVNNNDTITTWWGTTAKTNHSLLAAICRLFHRYNTEAIYEEQAQ